MSFWAVPIVVEDLVGATTAALIAAVALSLISLHAFLSILRELFPNLHVLSPRMARVLHLTSAPVPTAHSLGSSSKGDWHSHSYSQINSALTRQIFVTLFGIVFTIATLIPLTFITVRREAGVEAFLDANGDMRLPDSYVQSEEMKLGVSRVYWDSGYSEYRLSSFDLAFFFVFFSLALAT
jgi:hypothetical protein